MSFIIVENTTKQFTVNGPKVLDNISLPVEKGELITLLGSSGCGKTTLLRCIAGLSDITSGKIIIDGRDCTNLPTGERNIGMVFQQYSLFPNMTARQNIEFGLKMLKKDAATIKQKTDEMLEIVQLTAKANSYPAQMSGGQQQRVALARAIITEPSVLFLDEPLSAIDAKVRKSLQTEIRRIQQQFNITTIFVTHDQHEAMVMSDKIYLMDKGIIAQHGTPDEVYTQPNSYFTATFIGNNNVLTAELFNKVAGRNESCKYVAIRPETIRIYGDREQASEDVIVAGKIENVMINGSTIQYEVNLEGTPFWSSVLYNESHHFTPGKSVFFGIKLSDCIMLNK